MDENDSDIGGHSIEAPGGVWDVVVVGEAPPDCPAR